MADLTTFMPVRKQPVGHVETFSTRRAAGDRRPRDRRPRTPPACSCASRAARAASSTLSQVSAGRKNHLHWEIDGSRGERRLARRAPGGAVDRPPRPPERAAAARAGQLARTPPRTRACPRGHAEGFGETFRELYRAVYTRGRGGRAARRAGLPDLRRRPRAGADRRRDRALARRGPVGRGAALSLGVVFDCDGTLVDSEPLAGEAWRRVLAPYGYAVTDEDLAACVGIPYARTHAYLSPSARALPGRGGAVAGALARAVRADRRAAASRSRTRSSAVARAARARRPDRGRLLVACASGWTARWPARAWRSRSRSRATRSSTASPRRTCSCSRPSGSASSPRAAS